MLEFAEISYGSDEYLACRALRNEVLRLPLGMQLGPKDWEGEEHQRHLVAKQNGHICATLTLKTLSPLLIKFRQMAVSTQLQKSGIGRGLFDYAEKLVQREGAAEIEFHARAYAVGFYEKLGYCTQGEPFIEATIPHIKMHKYLAG